ncbi:hypothetical protein ACFL2M_00675 [Patescibacteria group bacterium]
MTAFNPETISGGKGPVPTTEQIIDALATEAANHEGSHSERGTQVAIFFEAATGAAQGEGDPDKGRQYWEEAVAKSQ